MSVSPDIVFDLNAMCEFPLSLCNTLVVVSLIVKHYLGYYEFEPYCSASNCCFGHSCHLLNLLFQIHYCMLVCF